MSKSDMALMLGGVTLFLYLYAKSYIELGMWSRNLPEMDFREFHKLMAEHESGDTND